jgi:FMN-dependent NADH-azoreductase
VTQSRADLVVDTWDLWDGTLPPFGADYAHAKMALFAGRQPEGSQAEAWRRVRETFERFDAYDGYLFSVPMWNAGVPYILKQLIDVISQPGLAFRFEPATGYTGLLRGRRAAVIYTSAVYGPGLPPSFGTDFQQPFLNGWLRWAGVDDVREMRFGPNLVVADQELARKEAHERAYELGSTF